MEHLDVCPLCRSREITSFCDQNAFSRCRQCGLHFDNPRPSLAEISEHYNQEEQYGDWLKHLPEREQMWRRRLRLLLRHRREGSLLDVGAGIGQFLSLAREHFAVEGTELSATAVRLAREHYGIHLHRGTLEDLPPGKSFDVITLFHVLEHVPYPGDSLRAIQRFLRPNGILVIAVPNDVDSILTRRNRAMRRMGFRKYQRLGALGLPKLSAQTTEIHLSHFTSPVLANAVRQAGLEVCETGLDPYFSVHGVSRLARRKLRLWRHRTLQFFTGLNLYETIWMVARRAG